MALPRALSAPGQPAQPCAPKEAVSAAETYREPADGNWPSGALGLLLSCPRPDISGSWPHFTARSPPHASRSSIGSNQPYIPLQHQVALGRTEARLHLACTAAPPKRHKNATSRSWLQTQTEHHMISPRSGTPKEWYQQAQQDTGANLRLRRLPTQNSSYALDVANPHSQSA